jgi:hypothetical protein
MSKTGRPKNLVKRSPITITLPDCKEKIYRIEAINQGVNISKLIELSLDSYICGGELDSACAN